MHQTVRPTNGVLECPLNACYLSLFCRTVTVYIDKQAFIEKLSIPDDNSVHWFLIDRVSKNILQRGKDTVSPEEITQISSHSN